jgi:hypothetical protein
MTISVNTHSIFLAIFDALDTPKVFKELHEAGISKSQLNAYLPLMCKLNYLTKCKREEGLYKPFVYNRIIESIPGADEWVNPTLAKQKLGKNTNTSIGLDMKRKIKELEEKHKDSPRKLVSFSSLAMQKKLIDTARLASKEKKSKTTGVNSSMNMV